MTHIYAYTHMYMYISIYIYVCFGEHVLQAMVVASGQPDAKSIARTLPRGMA